MGKWRNRLRIFLGRSAGETSIDWTLLHPVVTGAIVGARSIKQVEGVIDAVDFRLSEAEPKEIAEVLP
jgi:aryl-alcohol dehydrogenase-like predicted oxidoreductase